MVGIHKNTTKSTVRTSFFLVCFVILTFFASSSVVFAAISEVDSWILKIGLGVGGFFSGLGGMLFDISINYFVLQMGDLFLNRGLGGVVNSIWSMVRDLFNIVFIFTLVYIGLRTIWDADDSRTKKLLGGLIAAALLINFSLYIAKVVVDVANYTAVTIYSAATSGITGNWGIQGGDGLNYITGDKSISGAYMQVLNVSSWFEGSITEGVFVYSIMAMLFLMFLGFVLAYGALMLTARFIAIIFYLMFSPFMFLGWVLPQFQSYATKWWKGLIGYSFFAPVYIFMLYVGLFSLQQMKSGLGGDDAKFSSAFTPGPKDGDTFTIFLFFIIGTGFLIAATKVAGAMSQGGAAIGMSAASKMGSRAGGYAARFGGNASFGMAARTGRITAGWAGQKIADSDKLKDAASRKNLLGTLSRGALKSSRIVGNASFDARRVGGVGKKIGIGEGKKGGYKTRRDEVIKDEKAFAKSLGTLDETDEGVALLINERDSMKARVVQMKTESKSLTDDERDRKLADIASEESKIKEQETRINREKNRRQIGSAGDIEKLTEEKERVEEIKKTIRKIKSGFRALSDEEKKKESKKISKFEKELKEIAKKVKVHTGSSGYAGVLEERGIIGSALFGRINNQDTQAGKEIRKLYEKEVKKTKEDRNFDSIREALEKKAA